MKILIPFLIISLLTTSCHLSDDTEMDDVAGTYSPNISSINEKLVLDTDSIYYHYYQDENGTEFFDTGKWYYNEEDVKVVCKGFTWFTRDPNNEGKSYVVFSLRREFWGTYYLDIGISSLNFYKDNSSTDTDFMD